jgi:hypothetical protein
MEEIDRIQYVKIADSFVKVNKTISFRGHGEAKLYISPINDKTHSFFYEKNVNKFFIKKKDILTYLRDAKYEYTNQEMGYRAGNISENYKDYFFKSEQLKEEEEIILEDGPIKSKGRYYIRGSNEIWFFLREIFIPIISYFQIVKYSYKNENVIRFIPFIDYNYDKRKFIAEKSINQKDKNLSYLNQESEKRDAIKQKKYRDKLLDEFGRCIVTTISIEPLLQACHIKPHRYCKKKEEFDSFNGIILTPTFHKLFDSGLMSFNKSKLIFSSHILGLRQESIIKKSIVSYNNYSFEESRQNYINWHFKNIFKFPN